MDDITNENSYIKTEIHNEKEKLYLPKIDLKLIPNQKEINDISRNQYENENSLKLIKSQTFLTSKITETNRKDEVKPEDIFNNDAVVELLKGKIEINHTLSNNNIFVNRLQKSNKKIENKKKIILNRNKNENILFNGPIKVKSNKKKLKLIKVSNIFNEAYEEEKDKCDDDSNYDRSLYNIRLYNYLKEAEEEKRIKSVRKRNPKKPELEHVKSDWRKKINCSLDYKYIVNKYYISGQNSLIKSINKNSKIFFDEFRKESNDILDQIWNS